MTVVLLAAFFATFLAGVFLGSWLTQWEPEEPNVQEELERIYRRHQP